MDEGTGTPEVFLVDGSSFVHRGYHQAANQDPRYNVRADGLPTGATRMFTTKMLQFLRDGAAGIRPTHMVVAFDTSRAGHRRDIFPEYKANRESPPDDLKAQFPYMRHAVRALGLTPVEAERHEADDIIATYCRTSRERGYSVTVISADKDLMQLVCDTVRFYDSQSGTPGKPGYRPERNYDVEGVIERWEGARPDQIADVMALLGDKSDNIPGVPSIGPKIAVALLQEFGSLEGLLERAGEIKQAKRRETILAHLDSIRLSRRLVTLNDQVPLEADIDAFRLGKFDAARLVGFTKAMEFPAITKSVAKAFKVDPNTVEADPELRARPPEGSSTESAPIVPSSYAITSDIGRLGDWLDAARRSGFLAVDTVTDGGRLVGVALATSHGSATYVPLGHEDLGSLFGGRHEGQPDPDKALAAIRAVLEDASVRKVGHDTKASWHAFRAMGITPAPFDDTLLMAYTLDNGRSRLGLAELATRHLRHSMIPPETVTGLGKGKTTVTEARPEELLAFAAERADVVLRVRDALEPRLVEGYRKVYEELELPMVEVLWRMERRGVRVDRALLRQLSAEFAERIARLDGEIQELAGTRFQVGSPKQVGDILFGHLGLPGARKTPSGQWETRANLLDELAASGHVIAERVLEYRQASKLKSTYSDALQIHARPGTDRVHTTLPLASTNTGRLSSVDPNLQNIPVRTEDGRKIRRAFVAAPGRRLVSADYSQIELRVLAHAADVPELKDAFARGIDIHALTASEMFGVPLDRMDPQTRRSAKAINFGIVYGISGFGLSNQLGIPVQEATDYIRRYFARFPGIPDYMEKTRRQLHDTAMVTTLFGREIHFPQVRVLGKQEVAAIERAAVNAPIQGTAAEIVRFAMIDMEPALAKAGVGADMLLQVHDELVFEVDEDKAEAALPVIASVMENACEGRIPMSVRLEVDAHVAGNWDDAH